jgi:hypothetical protein
MHIFEFIEKIGIEKWDLPAIFGNPIVSPEEALNYIKKLSENSDILPGQILDYLHDISANPNLTVEFILTHQEIDWDFRAISQAIDVGQIIAHPELPWDYNSIVENKTLTIDRLVQIADKITNWARLTDIMEIKDIVNHPELPWERELIGWNATLLISNDDFEEQLLVPEHPTVEYLINHPDTDWTNFTKYVDYTIVINRPDLPWNYDALSEKDLPIDVIREHQKLLNFQILSMFTNPQIILDNPDLPWDYDYVSGNNRLSFQMVLDNPNIPWNYYDLSHCQWRKFNS